MNKQEIEKAINGLKHLKPILQAKLLKTNYEGLGVDDARELGEHFTTAIQCMRQQLTSGWIPISQELPDKSCHFNLYVTMKHIDGSEVFSAKVFWEYGEFKRMNGKKLSDKWVILAWMPEKMPKPYREASE